MTSLNSHTTEGYSYLKKPTLLGDFSFYVRRQCVWPDVLRWKGSVFLPTLPPMVIMTALSCAVCFAHINYEIIISIPVSVLGTVSVALGLLLAFRVNTAYDRYWEGRKLVQTVMGTIRNLARQIWINVPEETEDDHREKMRCIKLLLAFFVATKHHLRQEYGINYPDLERLLPPKWEPASTKDFQTKKNAPSKTTTNLRQSVPFDVQRDAPSRRTNIDLMSKKPAISLCTSNFIKPKSNGEYMEADDPTDIANIRRSLIRQEFPYSDLNEYSSLHMVEEHHHRSISPHEETSPSETTHLLDESTHTPPTEAVHDDVAQTHRPTYQTTETSLINRFKRQHLKSIRRHLDHSKFTSPEDLPYLGDSDISLPLEILFRIALYVNQAKAQGKIESSLVSVTTNSLDTLVNSLTAFERIVHTPIPKAYNIHLKQAVMLYIFFLPFALVDTLGWLVAPVVTLVTFTLFGIEAIGAEIENPFGYDDNDLPLNRYCQELTREVEYIIYHIPTQSTSILLDGY
ncbi:Bestrophin, RFP-TM, chloride channel-domain-containing protein [Sporodiniella umbellata]|nr:Bestrophin, RFP-TM, chloride channel-domain-containing protein [Sporodiniella umbellata]